MQTDVKPEQEPLESFHEKNFRFRASYQKTGSSRFLSHLELASTLRRAFEEADIPLSYSQGKHPRPQIAFGPALPMNVESRYELIDFFLYRYMEPDLLIQQMNAVLPPDLHLMEAAQITRVAASLSSVIDGADYRICLAGLQNPSFATAEARDLLEAFRSKQEVLFTKHKTQKVVNIKDFVHALHYDASEHALTIEMRIVDGTTVGIHQVLNAIFGVEREWPAVRENLYVRDGHQKRSPLTMEWENLQMQKYYMDLIS